MSQRRTASSALVTLLLIAIATNAAAAQMPDSARAAQDSLVARLERAEEAIELLKQQLAAQAEAEVRTLSRVSLEITGRALVNAFANSGRVNTADVPQFVFADGADFPPAEDFPRGSVRLSARQTMLGLVVSVADVLGEHGLEARRMETTWVARAATSVERKFRSDHVNLAIGFEF